ncbi:Putative phosphopantetheine binding ACP domain, ACP-like superfamily [Colletotrichum destructivum]|uniref:Phosphopantetheine binding ACP domain, ACP-like superfamily n=1 Tax=Colletotrichum destructivum TaxID=34406 RepID=A0AAX4IUG2_9PEZI|nr:Putative phosphopantetheine binding ACP domain, ACP-like superfamily [Colletotrichum destructivum]
MSVSEENLLLALRGGATMKQRPLTETELSLQHLWAEALGIPKGRILAQGNFSRLGGDSINAIKLVGACRAACSALEVFQIFQNPTVNNMANAFLRDGQSETPLQEGMMAVSARQHGASFLLMVFRVPVLVNAQRLKGPGTQFRCYRNFKDLTDPLGFEKIPNRLRLPRNQDHRRQSLEAPRR